MKKLLIFGVLVCAAVAAAQIPAPTETPGSPYSIQKTWFTGGVGTWDYLTVDSAAHQLFIAHGASVQVVDLESGALAGKIEGLRDAHAIALDSSGEFGYISDGAEDAVKVFDRRTFETVASIPTGPTPRSLAIEPQTGLLFVVCGSPLAPPAPPADRNRKPATPPAQKPPDPVGKTSITVIDLETRKQVGTILITGHLGFAQADGNGLVYVNVVNRGMIVRLDAQGMATTLRKPNGEPTQVDLSGGGQFARFLGLGSLCPDPTGLAIDHPHSRLFVACANMKMAVVNSDTGEVIASLPTGPGTEAVDYDSSRGLIYSANGGAQGTLTIVRQHSTDSYAVVQNLPTRQRARTLALDQSTGQVYLVTDLMGVNLDKPGGIGTLKTIPVSGSFQVLVVGN